jgi:hypothetical protein
MKCPVENKLLLYIDRELSDSEITEFETHLNDCACCKDGLHFFSNIEEAFHCEIFMPDDFTDKVMNKIDKTSSCVDFLLSACIALIFLLIFFFPCSYNLLPLIGTVIVKCLPFFKYIPWLVFELLKQNMTFLVFYSTLLMAFITYFIFIKKRPVSIKHYII